jgi:23S rRNA pseudouridine1911/1915/1917 synthase
VADPTEPVCAGDALEYLRPPWIEPSIPTYSTPITYIYCDADVAIISKPTEVPCLPGGLYYENTVLMLLKKQSDPLGNPEALNAPVHRLGRGTTGALVLARTASARRFLMKAFQDHLVEKTYLAIMQGIVEKDQFDVTQPIGKVPYRLCKLSGFLWSASDAKDAKRSFSSFSVLARDTEKNMTLCKVRITTGRPHQIRIHSAFSGHPLVGDPLYLPGGLPDEKIIADSANASQLSDDAVTDDDESARDGSLPGDCGYFLHSWKVKIPHPDGTKSVDITCPPPPAFDATFSVPSNAS